MSGSVSVRAGFIPLLDAALLIAAAEKGFAAGEGLELALQRETSWANIRDRIAIGHFDVAHMLAPLPIAASLGLVPLAVPMVAPFALGRGGNAVTVSTALWALLEAAGAPSDGDPVATGRALKAVIAARAVAGEAPLTFAVVNSFSGHNYELRYWLAAAGIDPWRDVQFAVVPPPFMADALSAGRIDAYCVGEPWNTAAVMADVGRIVTTKAAIWPDSIDKVLGMRADWADAHADVVRRLIVALQAAAEWCGAPANHEELAAILAAPEFLGVGADRILAGLSGRISLGSGAPARVPDFLSLAGAATEPQVEHGLWLYSQMVRWGQAELGAEAIEAVRRTMRADVRRAALGPGVDQSTGAVQLFDGVAFDGAAIGDYLAVLPFGGIVPASKLRSE
ncbi:MAG: CmpA/NrtA family ABC transporter substrate-binding protein [Hyphomicrobiales bacterium]